MTVITGDKIKTSFGVFIVADRWSGPAKKGDVISHENKRYTVKRIVPPTNPDGKWSVEVIPE